MNAQRIDYDFTTAETPLIRLPAETRKISVIGPPGSTYRFDATLTTAAAERLITGAAASGAFSGDGVTATSTRARDGDYWPTAAHGERREIIDGAAYLKIPFVNPATPTDHTTGDYQIFGYPSGYTETADLVFTPIQHGRITVRERPAYFDRLDFINRMLERIERALLDADESPDSSALIEIETPDGRRQRYLGVRALLAARWELEQRKDFLRATDNGRRPFGGFRLNLKL